MQDIDCHHFLLGTSHTYCNLTTLDEPDIFDINNNQKHILNQLIHFALKIFGGLPNLVLRVLFLCYLEIYSLFYP